MIDEVKKKAWLEEEVQSRMEGHRLQMSRDFLVAKLGAGSPIFLKTDANTVEGRHCAKLCVQLADELLEALDTAVVLRHNLSYQYDQAYAIVEPTLQHFPGPSSVRSQ